ncbi:MAG: glycoside hydrolase family 127 protein [Pirellulales bacterium]|nr:glycoside hydrolase family 127 protein [Pirellulales bacterium]
MNRIIALTFSAALLARAASFGQASDAAASQPAVDLAVPRIQMTLEGPMAARVDGIIRNWLIPAPDANPGMLEMMRLRDRQPPYENPVPWAGEFAGKYLTSCALICRLSDDPTLREVTARVMRELIRTQAGDGYLGPFPDNHLLGRWDLWGHYHCMLAMILWHQDTGDTEALQAACRAADLMCATFLDTGKRVHDAGSHEMNMAVIHALGLLYRQTKKDAYLRLMREIEQDWQKPPAGDYHRMALRSVEFYQTPKPRWESLHPMIGLAELFRITGDDSYRQSLVHWWRSIYRTDVHNSGSFSTSEQAVGNPFQPGAIETCCTVAWMELSVEALRLTGDSRIADALEHATWNAALGHQHPSGRWCTYDTPMNGKRLASAHSIVFQARPGTPELNCCSVNGANGLGLIGQWAMLGGKDGLYLNYYGPGKTEVKLADGSTWSFIQTTDYPSLGTVQVEVRPPQATALPLLVRIPEWARKTEVAVNGAPVEQVTAGSYLKLDRTWNPGDKIVLQFDLGLRALRGDHHVQFNTSLMRGPILLAFDQKHNTMEPSDMPELDLDSLRLTLLAADDPLLKDLRFGPIVAVSTPVAEGQRVVLCDFGSAGAYGTLYRSWVPVTNAPLAPFHLKHPEANAVLPVEEVFLAWNRAEPGSVYDLRIAAEAEFKKVLLHKTDLERPEFRWAVPADSGVKYYWQVESRHGDRRAGAVNGPLSFTLDSSVPTSLQGVVIRAALAGMPEPQEGRLLVATDLAPAAGRDGAAAGALAFNGKSTKLVYDAPQFPLRTYTFAAWLCPQGLAVDGRRWHQIVSAWCAPVNDPLRVSIQDMELVVAIEQPGGGCRLSGGRVENGKWYHVAVVKKFTELTLYVNGKPVGRATVPTSYQPGPKNVGIGCNPNYTGPEVFQGALAEFLLVREALPEETIRKLAGVL